MMAREKSGISLRVDCGGKRLLLLLALLLLPGVCYSQNILPNGGFEQKSASPRDPEHEVEGWWMRDCTQWATDAVHSGSYAAKVEVADMSRAGERNYWQSDMISASGKLRISCWVKMDGVTRGEKEWHMAGVVVRMYDESKQGVTEHYGHFTICRTEGTSDWTNIQEEIELLPEAKYIAVECGLYACTGKLWVDDIEVISEGTNSAQSSQ